MDKLNNEELSFLFNLLLSLLNSYQRDISLLDSSSNSYDIDLEVIKNKYNFVVGIWNKLGCCSFVDK